MRSVFLQDADALVAKAADALAITRDNVDEIAEELMTRYL